MQDKEGSMSNNSQYSYSGTLPSSTQRGAVLIVVLLFLVLIILAGVIAVKQSTTDLRLATSDQINTLLLQSSDNANQNIEQGINGSSDTEIYNDMLSYSGPFGHFILDTSSADHEFVFCFRPRDQFFDINRTSIVKADGSTILSGGKGYCDPEKPKDYVSKRNASMTQVNILLTPPDVNDEAFSSYTIGQDSGEISSKAFMFDINSTAVLPAYANVGNCFEKTSRSGVTGTDSINGCMANAGVPSTILYEKANVENQSKRTKCVNFGKGEGLLCTLPSS